jgi:hypothetical protein
VPQGIFSFRLSESKTSFHFSSLFSWLPCTLDDLKTPGWTFDTSCSARKLGLASHILK